MRWANEEKWDALIESAASRFQVPADLVRAIIAVESQFNPAAYRIETAQNDQSSGLMQILLNTARGEGYNGPLGEPGSLTGIFNPSMNIVFGTSYLAGQYERAGGDVEATASAYNGGWNPSLGFGAKATRPVTVCLARDRNGKCIKVRNVPVGEYGNQPYVDAVLRNLAYFHGKQRTPTGGSYPSPLVLADYQRNHESQGNRHPRGDSPWTLRTAFQKVITWLFKLMRGH